jgi:hypothetical protein
MSTKKTGSRFVICVGNEDCDDLEPRKIYIVIPDATAAKDGYVRVIDESGEDYLYPETYFVPIDLPSAIKKALLSAA